MSNDSFGSRLNYLIKSNDVSIKDFGEMVNLSTTIIYKYFNNKAIPSVNILQRVIDIWPNTNLYWLLMGIGEPIVNEGNTAILIDSNKENRRLLEENERLKATLAERDKTVEFQEKSLDTIIAMLKDRGIDIYEED